MSTGTLEHANISVTQPQRLIDLLTQLLGWQVRWRGKSAYGGDSVHLGNADQYLAIYTSDAVRGDFSKGAPLNHIGLVVDDLDEAERVVAAHGLTPSAHEDYEPGRRFYFFDWDGIEFEVVSYA